MPLILVLGVAAVVATIAMNKQSRPQSTGRTLAFTAGIWVAMLFVAILLWAVGTLIFGR